MERLIYNSQEASQLLSISRSTLLRLTAANKLQKVNISSRRVGWAHSELLRYISATNSHCI
jgi:predicted DNA-binding transcriptional regulator AlpA